MEKKKSNNQIINFLPSKITKSIILFKEQTGKEEI